VTKGRPAQRYREQEAAGYRAAPFLQLQHAENNTEHRRLGVRGLFSPELLFLL
jgi:hypothetical protein